MATTQKPAAAAKSAARPVITAQDQMDDAPARGKWGTYFKLPEGVKRFAPKDDRIYNLTFLPWKPGKMHPRHGKSAWVTNFFFSIHVGIGPNEQKFACIHGMTGEACPVCEDFQVRRTKLARDDKKGWDSIKDLRAKNRELFFIHDNDGERNNLQIWDESTVLFGDFLRERMTMKEKYKRYADFTEGMTVCVKGKKESMGPGSSDFVKFGTIDFEDRREPISDFLVKAAEKFRIDECIFLTPYATMKKLLGGTGGATLPTESEEVVDSEPVDTDVEPEVVETQEDSEPFTEDPVTEEEPEQVQEEEEVETEEEAEPQEEEEVEEVVEEEPEPPPPVKKPPVKTVVKPAATAAKPGAAKPAATVAKKPVGK